MTLAYLKNKIFKTVELPEEYIRLKEECEKLEAELIKELMV